jgi:hypothetical protein
MEEKRQMSTIHPSLDAMMAMWNERDLDKIASHVAAIMDPSVEFCDPLHHIQGREAFAAMARKFRMDYPRADVSRSSKVDHHHDRYRYHWLISQDGKAVLPGFDVAQIGADGKIKRIDGFFGPLQPE